MGWLFVIIIIILLKTIWVLWMCHGNSSFETEKTDILKRRRYLINQTMVSPKQLLGKMPAAIGEQLYASGKPRMKNSDVFREFL